MNPIEIMENALLEDWAEKLGCNPGESSVTAIRALEQAGYRIVGPEPTPEMGVCIREELPFLPNPAHYRAGLVKAIAAAPRWSEAGTDPRAGDKDDG